jgi:hypothetical protein
MKTIDSSLQCPSCQEALRPKVLGCDHCGVKVEGPFQLNEFATLGAEDLHFLRIFVRCEGKVREMESALGLSYPTIRARLTELKNKLGGEFVLESEPVVGKTDAVGKVLEQLQSGKITFKDAMKLIKQLRSE